MNWWARFIATGAGSKLECPNHRFVSIPIPAINSEVMFTWVNRELVQEQPTELLKFLPMLDELDLYFRKRGSDNWEFGPVASRRTDGAYWELLYAVARKFEGETRHQTALRYIREAETVSCEPCKEGSALI